MPCAIAVCINFARVSARKTCRSGSVESRPEDCEGNGVHTKKRSDVNSVDFGISLQLSAYFRTPARSLPTFAPADFETNWVSTGTALATMSGESPSFENALAMDARPLAERAIFDSASPAPLVPIAAAAGAAFNSEPIPGTAFET